MPIIMAGIVDIYIPYGLVSAVIIVQWLIDFELLKFRILNL